MTRDRMRLEEASDEDLVEAYHHGRQDAVDVLLTRYRGFTRLKARSYFLVGADKDDIVQEGMIGLYKAIRDFSGGRGASFRSFAETCITRQVLTAVKTAARRKHVPLNRYVSLSTPLATDEDPHRTLMDVLPAPDVADPGQFVVQGEDLHGMKMAFAEILSGFEAEVLHLYVEGKSYQEIAQLLHKQEKSIDNALQRIKRKIELHLRRDEPPRQAAAGA